MTHTIKLDLLEVAGMTNSRGRVGGLVEAGAVLRPEGGAVRLDRKRQALVYETYSPMVSDVQRAELLNEFIRLNDASPEEILKFAKTYGVLNDRASREERRYSEDLSVWRECAVRARATLALAASIELSEATSPSDWNVLRPWWFDGWAGVVKSRYVERRQLTDVLNAWLQLAEIRAGVYLSGTSTRLVLTNLEGTDTGQLTMLGVLALQIVRAVGRAGFIETCSGCKEVYLRERRAQTGRANYCGQCGIKAALRDAQARLRARKRATKRHAVRRRRGGAK